MSLWKLLPAICTAALLGACSSSKGISAPDQGRLLATGGVSQVEGAGGAGLTNWALITGYGTEDSYGGNVHYTQANLPDFTLRSYGGAVGIGNRVELSYARQDFDLGETGPRLGLPEDFTFNQDIYGAKLRVLGNAVYDQDKMWPQISVGAQYKKASESGLVQALGAQDDESVDVYLSGTKLFLDKSLLLTGTARLTEGNQLGLLGFGGDKDTDHSVQFEGSAVYLINKRLAVGADYRTKPDNLSFAKEDDAFAAYAAYFPSKHVSITLAGVDLGDIALQGEQRGVYASLQLGY